MTVNYGFIPSAFNHFAEMEEEKVWIQFFFHDGSVSQGKRVPSYVLKESKYLNYQSTELLRSCNRTEGVLMVWGIGVVITASYNLATSSSALESVTWASESVKP